jgi:hypothetical protein
MYKIIDKAGTEVERGFISFGDALKRIRKLKKLGLKEIFVVDAGIRVVYKRSVQKRKIPKLLHSAR